MAEVSHQVDARFKALAGCVSEEDWSKLIGAVSERMLTRLTLSGLIQDASPDQIKQGLQEIGQLLVEYTNVALTCVAQGELAEGPKGE